MDNNLDENNTDPLALDSGEDESIEYDVSDYIEPEIIIEDCPALRRSKRSSNQRGGEQQEADSLSNSAVQLSPSIAQAEANVEPLFPITPKMKQCIKRMKQRMLATLRLSDEQLSQRCAKRANQTQESRRRAANADTAYRRKEADKKMARTKIQRAMETPEQLVVRRGKKREEGRRYRAKRGRTETTEQKSARQEYQRTYSKSRKPMNFV